MRSSVKQMSMFPYPDEQKQLGWKLKWKASGQDDPGAEKYDQETTTLLNGQPVTITCHNSSSPNGYFCNVWVLSYRHYRYTFNDRPDAYQAAEVLNNALVIIDNTPPKEDI